MRSAVQSGLWYGTETTPVPSLIRRVCSSANAEKSIGSATISVPPEWCSPIHTSS